MEFCSHWRGFVRQTLWSFSSPVRRPSKGCLAAPFAIPGLAPASLAASRCLRSFTLPTDRRRFAPAQRRLSPHPCGSSWQRSFTQRVRMAPLPPRCMTCAFQSLSFCFLFFIFYFFCGLSGGGVGGIRSAERRGKARPSRMDAARERNEPGMANPRVPSGLSDKRGNSAERCARTPQGADCKGPRLRTFARPPARCG